MKKIIVNILCRLIPNKNLSIKLRECLLKNKELEELSLIKESMQNLVESLIVTNKDIANIKNSTKHIHWLVNTVGNTNLNVLRFHEFLSIQTSLEQYSIRKINKDNLELFFKYKILDDVRTNVFNAIINEIIHSNGYKLKDSIVFESGDIFIDIGANIGVFSIYLAKKYPNIKVYAFEPGEENYKLLLENIKLNNVNNVFPIQKAVGNYNGETIIEQTTSWGALSKELIQDTSILGDKFLVNEATNYVYNNNKPNIIEMLTFDKVFELLNIDKCKYLKVDCEGGEIGLLNTTILNRVEYATVDCHFNDITNNQIFDYCKNHINPNNLELQIG